MNSLPNTLLVRNLEVWRGDRCLLGDLSFDVGSGRVAIVTGPNGSGKTTLLRILAGLAPARDGSVLWCGMPVGGLPFERRAEIAYRGHLEGTKKDFTVRENVDFYRSLWGYADSAQDVLVELELDGVEHRRVRHLSAGQKRRLSLATLKVCGAKLWILDEPMTNLDFRGRQIVSEWVEKHVATGGSAIVATHQPGELSCATLAIEL